MERRVAFHTLGCKVNQSETEALAGLFRNRGYRVVGSGEEADVYVVNTCTVTHLGDRKSRQLIRRVSRKHPDALVVVTGCYSQTAPEDVISIPGVDLVVGTHDRARIPELVGTITKGGQPLNLVSDVRQVTEFEELPVDVQTSRTRAFLKIQEGCNQYCTYCIVPYARGPVRSRSPERVLAELRRLAGAGFKEVVLTGIHTCAYGLDLGQGINLAWLINNITEEVPELPRLRLSSIEPTRVTESLVATIAGSPACCRHFHIPLQSGDDWVLHRMGRRYTTAEFSRVVELVRQRIPEAAMTTDMIVGFPGETDREFQNSLQFARSMGFSRIHVFKYSPRSGTPAASYPDQVAPPLKEERSSLLMGLASELAGEYARGFIGSSLTVLVEEPLSRVPPGLRMAGTGDNWYRGLSDNYLDIACPGPGELIGELVPTEITAVFEDQIIGRLSHS